ncbi:MAG: queuine tRNA-ribosyltransferase [Bacteroides sp. SM23_62_1]|nr:MAG: queuine tRNA-ribosyltransferase [Bacteroides sp. SM23_62_1]
MDFRILKKDPETSARTGILKLPHGEVPTPVFMPVGTLASVKGIHQHELADVIQAPIILSNTYHLYLRPGIETIANAGGLHHFMHWSRPILTDSGGYQVFSLAEQRKLSEEGAIFQSHIDGSRHHFTPENIIDIQRKIGADIMMVFDECTPYPCDYAYAEKSMELTHKWLHRGIQHFRNTEPLYGFEQACFPIVQGSVYPDLRKKSAEVIAAAGMEGNAIGGLSVGEPEEKMYEMIRLVSDILPASHPRYLMGVGTPVNLLEAIALGMDMFDCVIPTRNGRNGMLFTSEGVINIKNEKWKNDHSDIDLNGITFVDTQYSKAYLRHLIISKEILGAQIASIHNLGFYSWLMNESRRQIEAGTFRTWKENITKKLENRL